MHPGPFGYLTKLDGKRAELVQLMQKLVPRNRIEIFRKERNRSTPLDPKLMFHYYTKLGTKRVELVQLMHKFVPCSRFGIFHHECTRPSQLDPKLMYCCVS